MQCPYCHADMQRGYIQCRDGLSWTPKRQLVAALSSLGRGALRLENTMDGRGAVAYHCEACKLVLLAYGQREEA